MIKYLKNLLIEIFKCKYIGTFENIPIYLNSEFVENNGYKFSAIFKKHDNSGFIIAVDHYFLKMSKIAQKFILYHEIGHMVNGHLNKRYDSEKRINDVLNNSISAIELEADIYSCSKIGINNFIYSINEIINFLNEDDIGKKELSYRKNWIVNNYKYILYQ